MQRETTRIRVDLLDWYRDARRDLPWRRTREPYAIWVSEVMLQQTTVAAVIPYWERFLGRFPDLTSLARAPEPEVLAAWAGLGYYRRVRNMQRAARAIVEAGEDRLPESYDALRALPGIGPYTAAAVGSIAFGIAEPVVDGNVVRVLTRLDAMEGDPTRLPLRRVVEERARELLDPERAGDFNQALMELGATVCTPRSPSCRACPWRSACLARRTGDPTRFPELPKRRPSVALVRAALHARGSEGRLLLARIPEGEPNSGFWEPPTVTLYHQERDEGRAPLRWSARLARRARAAFAEVFDLDAELADVRAHCRHGITHHRIAVHLVDATLLSPPPSRDDLAWAGPEERAALPLSAIARKLLA